MKVMASLVDHYLQEMAESVAAVEKSEAVYRELVDVYTEEYGPGTTADYKAASDPRLQAAISDGAFYRSRATMYASAATALLLYEQVKP